MTATDSSAISKRSSKEGYKRSKRSMRRSSSVGVEIGYSTIYMVLLKTSEDGEIILENCRTFDFDPNLKVESSAFTSILKSAMKQFCGSSKELAIWVAPKLDQARLYHIKIPKVGSAKLPGAVYWGLQREDAFLEDETVVDFQIEEGKEPGSILNVTGALVERECIEGTQKAFSQTGYTLSGIGLPLLALGNIVKLHGGQAPATPEAPAAPVLVCQLGQISTSVSVLLEGRLIFTRNIQLGLQSFAETLAKAPNWSLSQDEACEIVLNLGLEEVRFSPNERQLHEQAFILLLPVLERTVRQIRRTVEYYQSNFESAPIEVIFIGGEVAARGPLFQFISEQLAPKVIAIDPFDTPGLEEITAAPSDKIDRVAYGTAFGLALKSSQKGVNFAHTFKDSQNETRHKKIATIVSLSLMFLALAAALFYNTQRLKLIDLEAERNQFENELRSLGPRLTEDMITEASEEVRLLGERRKAAVNRYEGIALLSEITRLTPENVSLLHVSAAMGGNTTPRDSRSLNAAGDKPEKIAADREGTLLLKGVVTGVRTSLETSLTIYIARLDQSGLFDTVEVESTELVQSSNELHLIFTLNIETIAEIEQIIKK